MTKKILDYVLVFLSIVTLNFFLPRFIPGSPLTAIYGDSLLELNPALRESIIETFGLDLPLWMQFWHYLAGMARGDLGHSIYFQQPVMEVIIGGLPWTILLSGTALVISTVAGVFLGVESARRRGKWGDGILLFIVMFINGLPVFFLGMLLIVFVAINLSLFPTSGAGTYYVSLTGVEWWLDTARHLVLPSLALALTLIPRNYLLMRNSMVTVMEKPYMTIAKGKGLKKRIIAYRHGARSALLPVVTRLGMTFGLMITGGILVEKVFAYPGLGHLFTLALYRHDYPLMQGVLLVIAIMVLGGNLAADLVALLLDPRVKENAF